MKRKIAAALAVVMALPTIAFAADVSIYVNDTLVETDQPPVIENGTTLVPLRAIAEALGADVEWDGETKTAVFTQGEIAAQVTVGESYITVGDGVYNAEIPVGAPAVIVNSRTMIPVRALSEGLGFDVDWDGETKTVSISSKLMDIDDTSEADEQIVSESSEADFVYTYAVVLQGMTSIIDAVEYEDDEYAALKTEITELSEKAYSMSDEELAAATERLTEICDELLTIADEQGVSDIVENYVSQIQEEISSITAE